MIESLKKFFLDIRITPFVLGKTTNASLFFLIGVILKEQNISLSLVFYEWAFIYFFSGLFLFCIDNLNFSFFKNILISFSLCFLSLVLYFCYPEQETLFFLLFICFSRLIIRESINSSILYIRDKNREETTVNFSTAFMNEVTKILASFALVLWGYIIPLGLSFVMLIIFLILSFLFYIDLKYFVDSFNVFSKKTKDKKEKITIGIEGKCILFLSFFHNGVFSSSIGFLTLTILDKLKENGWGENGIYSLSWVMGLSILAVLSVFYYIRNKSDSNNIGKEPDFFMLSIILITLCLFLIILSILFSSVIGIVSIWFIGGIIALMQVIGGYYSLGFLQFLDRIGFNDLSRKRKIMNMNTTICSFSPGFYFVVVGLLVKQNYSLSDIEIPFLLILAFIELALVFIYIIIKRKFLNKKQ